MPRIRTIKPEFTQSESMGRVSREGRLLFVQLWTICDDLGRCRASSRMLASLLYPYDDDATTLISGWLEELEAEQCIRRYRIDNTTYLDIPKWLEHQKIDHPSKSRIPEFREDSRGFEKSSGTLAPRARAQDLGPRTMDLGDSPPTPPQGGSREFHQFWDAYPHKVGKLAAECSFGSAIKKISLGEMLAALESYKLTKPPDRQWCNPSTWLTQGRWTDQPALVNGTGNGHDKSGPATSILRAAAAVAAEQPGDHGTDSDAVIALLGGE